LINAKTIASVRHEASAENEAIMSIGIGGGRTARWVDTEETGQRMCSLYIMHIILLKLTRDGRICVIK